VMNRKVLYFTIISKQFFNQSFKVDAVGWILMTPSQFFDLMSNLIVIFFVLALAIIFIYEYETRRKEKG